MIKTFTVVCGLLTAATIAYTFEAKHRVQLIDKDIKDMLASTAALREESRGLQAEWTLRNNPDRLRPFADQYLALKPMTPAQFTTMANLDSHLPAPRAMPPAGPDETTDEPADTPVATTAPMPAAPARDVATAGPTAPPTQTPAAPTVATTTPTTPTTTDDTVTAEADLPIPPVPVPAPPATMAAIAVPIAPRTAPAHSGMQQVSGPVTALPVQAAHAPAPPVQVTHAPAPPLQAARPPAPVVQAARAPAAPVRTAAITAAPVQMPPVQARQAQPTGPVQQVSAQQVSAQGGSLLAIGRGSAFAPVPQPTPIGAPRYSYGN